MDTERNVDYKFPPVESNKGQMMLIYLPEGSVIVDRSNVDVQGLMGDAVGGVGAPNTNKYEVPVNTSNDIRRPDQIVLHRRKRRDWVHIANFVFAIYVTLASLVPGLLSTTLGISIFNAHSNLINGAIAHGDLMVSHTMSIERIAAGDLVLLRDANSWKLDVRQVSSTTAQGTSTTISTNTGANSPLTEVFTLENGSSIRYVTSRVPFLGYASMILGSLLLKILGALAIIVINIVAHFRRRHPHRDAQKMVLVSQ